MDIGWKELNLIERTKERLESLGYVMRYSKYNMGIAEERRIGVYCKDECNPIYARDAELYSGTLGEICGWINGIEHQNRTLHHLGLTSESKIKKAEEKYIKKQTHYAMLEKIKDPNVIFDKKTSELIAHPT